MAEQKILEKDIESILKDSSNCPEYCVDHHYPWTCNQCEAKRITDYIIRKEEEVRKKAAWEFYQYAVRFTNGRTGYVNIENLKEIAHKVFGVEVEE